MAYDLLFKDARIVDGSGMPSFRADLAVKDGRVAAVGKLNGAKAGRVIDCDGLALAPGFIDLHTHYDAQILWDPMATSSCWHGVTTILMGNCGFTLAPCKPQDRAYLSKMMARVEGIPLVSLEQGLTWQWSSFPEYLDALDKPKGVNVLAQIGHSALRYSVMGADAYQRQATDEEIRQQKALLREALEAGAFGFSTGQNPNQFGGYGEPVPSRLATEDEIVELAGVCQSFPQGIIEVASKADMTGFVQSDKEMFRRMSTAAGRPVVWILLGHHWEAPNEWRDLLAYMDQTSAEGHRIYGLARTKRLDQDFNFKLTFLFQRFPKWTAVIALPHAEKVKALRDPRTRAELREEMERLTASPLFRRRRLDLAHVKTAALPKNKSLNGQPLSKIAAAQGKSMVDAMLDLALEEDLQTQFIYIGTSNGDDNAVAEILNSPHSLMGLSDAGAHISMESAVDYCTHLLAYWVREKQAMSLEKAVHKLTFVPAWAVGLRDRGLLSPGCRADLVLFNPDTVAARAPELVADFPAGERRLVQHAEGIEMVAVNGQVTIERGTLTGVLPGGLVRANQG